MATDLDPPDSLVCRRPAAELKPSEMKRLQEAGQIIIHRHGTKDERPS